MLLSRRSSTYRRHCHAWMAIAIDEGYYEENLAGIDVGLLVDIPGRMGEGDWKVAAI